MSGEAKEFRGVTVVAKANVYFDGKVVSHTILLADGARKTVGVIFPGKFHFGTDKAERMEITAGTCAVKVDGKVLVVPMHTVVSTEVVQNGESFAGGYNTRHTLFTSEYKDYAPAE